MTKGVELINIYTQMTSGRFESKEFQYCLGALNNVSRSFALTIPMIEESIRTPILMGYLEARVLDSFEDEYQNNLSKIERSRNLDLVFSVLKAPDNKQAEIKVKKITETAPDYISNPNYLALVQNFDKIIKIHQKLKLAERNILINWFTKTVKGMKKFLGKKIANFKELDEYCYYVGGTIGGFLTDLLIKNTRKITARQVKTLKFFYADFGIFLQKVNIIRDFREDILKNRRIFWPQEAFAGYSLTSHQLLDKKYEAQAMSILDQMLDSAHKHVEPINKYISAIPQDFPGFKKAFSINFHMGIETLKKVKANPALFYGDAPVKIEKKVKEKILSQYI